MISQPPTDRRRHDPWYRGTSDGMYPEDGGTFTPDDMPASPEMLEMALSIQGEMQQDPSFA